MHYCNIMDDYYARCLRFLIEIRNESKIRGSAINDGGVESRQETIIRAHQLWNRILLERYRVQPIRFVHDAHKHAGEMQYMGLWKHVHENYEKWHPDVGHFTIHHLANHGCAGKGHPEGECFWDVYSPKCYCGSFCVRWDTSFVDWLTDFSLDSQEPIGRVICVDTN